MEGSSRHKVRKLNFLNYSVAPLSFRATDQPLISASSLLKKRDQPALPTNLFADPKERRTLKDNINLVENQCQ